MKKLILKLQKSLEIKDRVKTVLSSAVDNNSKSSRVLAAHETAESAQSHDASSSVTRRKC